MSLAPNAADGPVRRALADSSAAFRFDDVPPGRYRLEAFRAPFLRQWQELDVLSARTDTICVVLRAPPMDVPAGN